MAEGRTSRRNILIVAIIAVTMAVGGFLAARLVISPEDAAARAAPPPAKPITVAVERKRLDATIVTRGQIEFSGSVDVELADSSASNLVVTGRIPEVGALVQPGSVVIEVTGRPVIGFSGQLPTYRTLAPGSSGPDVEQLEATLAGLGYDPGPQDKVYDTATGAAVAAHYRTLGYEPPPPADDAKAAVPAAQAQVDATAAGVVAAQRALEQATAGPSRSDRLGLQGAIDQAQAAYDEAKQAPTPADPVAVAQASQALATAQNSQDQAEIALQNALAGGATDISAERAAVDQARQGVAAALSALDEVNRGGPPSQSAIAQALNQLEVAIALRDEALDLDTSAEQAQLGDAERAAAAAQAALLAAQAAAATPLPAEEVVWLQDLPRRVDEVLVTRGAVVDGPMMKVSGADLSVLARVNADEARLLKDGMPAQLTIPGSTEIVATITKIGGAPPPTDGQDAGSATGTSVLLQPQNVGAEQAQALRGENVKVTIPVQATSGEVLVVPVVALISDADGTPRVEVQEPDSAGGGTRFQQVAVGLSTGGDAEVSPVDAEGSPVAASAKTLQEGSLVVVGR